MGDVTQVLERLRGGEPEAAGQLFDLCYAELRGLAGAVFRSQPKGHTLAPTALVHEAYLKMVGAEAEWKDRVHFFAVAARAMRQVLINHARDKAALKRGSPGGMRVTLSDAMTPGGGEADLVAVHEALEKLRTLDERQGRIAELRFFGGLENKEIAEALGVSLRTVELDWKMAKETLAGLLGG
ncbi:MAG TPA: ECF-type sigma factor [Planctomycetota bacterium]|nr:ECF-type sigma factor [Planctomycetota bacterium]